MLELRGLNYGLKLVKEDRYHIYYNQEHNVAILAIPYCKDQTVDDIFNGISEDRYFPLIKFMNNHDNLIIKWTQVEGTTSDYVVYCDADYLDYCKDWNVIDMNEYLWTLDLGQTSSIKYKLVKDEEVNPFPIPFTIQNGIRYDHPDENIQIPLEEHYKGTPVSEDWWVEYLAG